MNTETSSKYAGRLLVKIGVVILTFSELIFLLGQIKDDFANGILFFVEAQSNIYFLGFLILYFSTLYFLGKKAGRSIAERGKKLTSVAVVFAVISAILITFYFSGSIFLLNNSIDPGYNKQNQDEMIRITLQNFVVILIFMIIVWIWATNRIAKRIHKPGSIRTPNALE